MNNILKKISVFFTGLILILIIFEICLRITGYIHAKNTSSDLDRQGKNDYTILSIGDSFTEGVGAPKDKDYPTQLQQILNTKTNKTFKVVNRGMSSQNTAQVLNLLQSNINDVKPNLIILLIGVANKWNFWGYGSSETNKSINKLLYRIRTFKLIKLLYYDIKYKGNKELIYELADSKTRLEQDKYKKIIKNFKNGVKKRTNNSDNYFDIGFFYIHEKNGDNAINCFEKGIKTDPDNLSNYYGVYYAYNMMKQDHEFIKWAEQKIKENSNKFIFYYALSHIYKSQANYDKAHKYTIKAIDIFEKEKTANTSKYYNYTAFANVYLINENDEFIEWFSKEKEKNHINSYLYDSLYKKYKYQINKTQKIWYEDEISLKKNIKTLSKKNDLLVFNWMESDIEKIVKICESQKIKLIIQNYPVKANPPVKSIENEILKNIAEKYSITFVNNWKTFDLIKERKKDLFQPQTNAIHCNANGYQLMAQNVYNKILEENIFNLDTIKAKNDSLIVN